MGILRRGLRSLLGRWRIRTAFTDHYRRWDWGSGESVSGPGSTLAATAALRRELPRLVRELGIRSLLDAGCGDFGWLASLDLPLDSYLGTDVVRELVALDRERYAGPRRRFLVLDVTRDRLPPVDLILCRDCLVHLRTEQISAALANFRRSGSTYLLATSFAGEHRNDDAPLGGWRPLNLERPPFGLGPPLHRIDEGETVEDERYRDKGLGLWRIGGPGRLE